MPKTIPVQDLEEVIEGFKEESEALRKAHEEKIRGIVRHVEARRREEILRQASSPADDGPEHA